MLAMSKATIGGVALIAMSAGVPMTQAHAAEYVGTLYGKITSGYRYTREDNSEIIKSSSLKGRSITINFIADVIPDVDDLASEDANYVINSVVFSIAGSFVADQEMTYNNGDEYQYGSASYSGNANAGSFYIGGGIYQEPDNHGLINFDFTDAHETINTLSGTGIALADFYFPRLSEIHRGYDITYTLDRGFVNGPGSVPVGVPSGVPEPESWVLMIMGFGLIGAGMRRRASKRSPLLLA